MATHHQGDIYGDYILSSVSIVSLELGASLSGTGDLRINPIVS